MPVLSTLGAMTARGFGRLFRAAGPTGLFAWGWDFYGQLGQGSLANRSSPVQVGALTTWTKTSAGYGSSYAIKSDGTLWSWGNNNLGQLGHNDTANRSSPTQIGALTTWSTVTGRFYQGYAIKTDGTLWAWGYNNATLGTSNFVSYSSPVQIGALTTWSFVGGGSGSTSSSATSAIKTDGTLWTWGWATDHNGGDNFNNFDKNRSTPAGGPPINDTSSPVQIGTATNWASLACGPRHSLAVTTSGALYAWGDHRSGECGQGETAYNNPYFYYPSPDGTSQGFCQGPDWTYYTDPYSGVYALDSTGTVCDASYVVWTVNGSNTSRWGYSSPVQIGALTTWSKVAASYQLSLAIKTDGTLWAWGSNFSGALGTGTTNQYSPVQVGALTTWARVFAGLHGGLAVKTDGTLWAWGYNLFGQLGLGDTTNRSSPVQVGTGTNWLSTGICASDYNALAIRS
jgi:alpha-tubulin suppressor-like RCC1 family protein